MKYHEFVENATWINSKGEAKQVCYLVMELLKGVELLDFINKVAQLGELDDLILRYIFLQIANTIHQLHKAGVAHRDIKPENIMLSENFEIKLIDLGYGIPLSGRKDTGFMNSRLGTTMYMAPEIQDKAIYYQGQDADCFALGVTMLVSKLMSYPWRKPDIVSDLNYRLFAANAGVEADKFWTKVSAKDQTADFKDLMESMLAYNPTSRLTMADILGHAWMRGPVCTQR